MTELSTSNKKTVRGRLPTMRAVVGMLKKEPNREFSIEDFKRLGIFPWAKNEKTIARMIQFDMKGDNELRARIEGEKNGKRYFIKGKNITSYIERYGEALMVTARRFQK